MYNVKHTLSKKIDEIWDQDNNYQSPNTLLHNFISNLMPEDISYPNFNLINL